MVRARGIAAPPLRAARTVAIAISKALVGDAARNEGRKKRGWHRRTGTLTRGLTRETGWMPAKDGLPPKAVTDGKLDHKRTKPT